MGLQAHTRYLVYLKLKLFLTCVDIMNTIHSSFLHRCSIDTVYLNVHTRAHGIVSCRVCYIYRLHVHTRAHSIVSCRVCYIHM